MEPEKLLPPGEPVPHISALPEMRIHRRPIDAVPKAFIPPKYPESPQPTLVVPPNGALSGTPSPKAQSWGVVISIVIIMLMIITGAFYAWGKRIAEENALITPPTSE